MSVLDEEVEEDLCGMPNVEGVVDLLQRDEALESLARKLDDRQLALFMTFLANDMWSWSKYLEHLCSGGDDQESMKASQSQRSCSLKRLLSLARRRVAISSDSPTHEHMLRVLIQDIEGFLSTPVPETVIHLMHATQHGEIECGREWTLSRTYHRNWLLKTLGEQA